MIRMSNPDKYSEGMAFHTLHIEDILKIFKGKKNKLVAQKCKGQSYMDENILEKGLNGSHIQVSKSDTR